MPCDNCACGKQGACGNATGTSSGDAVPLPRSYGATATSSSSSEQTPLLWKTTPASSAAAAQGPLSPSTACDRHLLVRRGGIRCCKELNEDASSSTPSFVDPDIIRDAIIGLSDGLSVPFALAAALSALGSTRLVVIGGLAELVSGAISMGVGGFLSAQAEQEHYANQARETHARVVRSCLAEMKREVAAILEPFGLGDDVAEKVAERLVRVEQADSEGAGAVTAAAVDTLPPPVTEPNAAPREADASEAPEHGLTPFLLKLGQGLEPIPPSRAYQSALIIGLSYFLGGLVPLIPYMLWPRVREALLCSVVVTGVVLLVFGAAKHRFTGGRSSVRAYGWAAVSTLAVGGIAAAASWSIVRAIEGHE